MSGISQYFSDQNITLAGVIMYAAVATVVYVALPKLLQVLFKIKSAHRPLLASASIVFFLSLFLPSPLIHGQNTNFATHFVGGGIFTGLIWLFMKLNLKFKANWLIELASLYLLVSGLGVANELFEFFANGVGLLHIPANDTWWDLFANTVGAGTFWAAYRLFIIRKI
jgi:hypothetical protein